jgi:hypothetical protein
MAKTKASNLPVVVTPTNGVIKSYSGLQGQQNLPESAKKNLTTFISPVQLTRIKQDVRMWRDAVAEAEFAYYPQRVKMQRLYLDTELNGHVTSCIERRKSLTMLREFMMCDQDENEDIELTKIFKSEWFDNVVSYIIDAEFYGYSLIALGNIIEDAFPELAIVKRWNVSPDRYNVTSYIYANVGQDFRAPEVVDWHIYVNTPNPHGTSPCGYGLFYKIGIYEIFLRNLLGFNGDFVERYSMPYVWAKTNKSDEDERGQLERDIQNMGSNGYAITDPTDDISFLEAALAGTGWNGYDNLEQRCEKKISKMILGHADAMDSTPGKLGPEQGGEESPISAALSAVQSKDGRKVERVINTHLIPKMIRLGFQIPEGYSFKYKNDDEAQDQRWNEDRNNNATATVAKIMKDAGMEMDPTYFTDRTGIPFTKIAPPAPILPPPLPGDDKKKLPPAKVSEKIQNKLKKLYK